MSTLQKNIFHIKNSDKHFFKENGYLIFENFIKKKEISELKEKITTTFNSKNTIKVCLKKSKFETINGSIIDENIPELTIFYDHTIYKIVNSLKDNLSTLTDRRIGLSINKTSQGHNFQAHFDRNQITAVMYISENFQGGSMLMHPRVRILLKGYEKNLFKKTTQRIIDKIIKTSIYLKLFSKSIEVIPKEGTLLIFEGNKTLHEVKPVLTGERITIQLAYDEPNKIYQSDDYYGAVKNEIAH